VTDSELFDPIAQRSVKIAFDNLAPRSHHSATLLTDGRLLIVGGLNSRGQALSDIAIWNSKTGQSQTLGVSLRTARGGHTARLLADGSVFVWGGEDQNGSPLHDGEIIDPDAPSVRLTSRDIGSLQDLEQPSLAASLPQSGETQVQIDQPIALRFSKPMNVTTLTTSTIILKASVETVPIAVIPAEGGMLAFIHPLAPLEYGSAYTLSISGASDVAGYPMPATNIIFTTLVGEAVGGGAGGDNSGSGSSSATAGNGTTSEATSVAKYSLRKLAPLQAEAGVTALAGQVLTIDGSPLSNVLIQIDGKTGTTDNTGRFLVRNTGSGHHVMIVDAGPASSKTSAYGVYRVGVDLKAGQTNSLNYTFWMTPLDTQNEVTISSPTTADMIVTNPNTPGLELHIPKGSVIRNYKGNVVTKVGITAIPMDRPPFPLKKGVHFPVYFTIQPGGAKFTNAGGTWSPTGNISARGATIYYSNYSKAKPGARYQFWNYDPNLKGWYIYGHGRVSGDSKKIAPEEGTQIWAFDGAMVSLDSNASPISPIPGNPQQGEPVDLQTGLLIYNKTDLVLNDVIPISLSRTFRQADAISRDFGIGANMPYDMFLVGDDDYTPEGYTYQDLILADGSRVHFTRVSPCLGVDGYCDFSNATYVATSTPTDFYGATLAWTWTAAADTQNWTVTKKDGTVYQFPESDNSSSPRAAALIAMYDRYGNALNFTRDINSNLTKVASPNGRWIQFSYDSDNRIIEAFDSAGRSTSYTYNPAGYLASATDANGGVSYYTYDTDGNMTSIQDPRGIVYLQNQYDANGMVSLQTQADGNTYQFAYTLDANGNVIQTRVTDPRGYQRIVTFNTDGFMTSDTHAVGKPEQQEITYIREPGTGLLLSMTDALNRTTTFTYDAMANATSITRLSGTSSAATETIAYDPKFFEPSAVTDPLGNTTSFTYDDKGNLLAVADPLGDTSQYTYNPAGQPVTKTDSLGNQTQFAYTSGILTSVTDALGRTASKFVDQAGRVAAATDPLGHATQIGYDPLGEITSITDPLENQTSFTYDGNGNLLTVTDANQHTTTYTYDNMDRVQTRKDPLGNQSSAQYDGNSNLTQATDRKGQITNYTYDGLNRPTLITFNDGSTVTNAFDAGNRTTAIVDSISGTISRSYDGLNDLLSETTPQGSVSYTYDADSRRQTMTVSGQSLVNYTFDNASRVTAIAQGSTHVSFGYDSDSRRTSLTLPNGITATYTYDAASQLAGIVYQGGALGVANLTYAYDLAGRRTSVGGSLASTQLPAPVSSAAYNANNQLTQWGSTTMTYDANGNTLNDGTNTYVWDARNRLVSADSNGAAFAYDPLGRRIGKTILSANTNFLYDGVNPVQELNGSTVTANLLTGGVDERFLRTTANETDNYLTDALGSPIALTSSTGNAAVQYSYGPFGATRIAGTTTNSFTFTGREIDGLGINYYRSRYYNPTIGRFISEDPIGFAGGINLYGYTGNDPIDYFDPLGFDQAKKRECTEAQETAAQLASGFEDLSNATGWMAFDAGVLTVLSGAGEAPTLGGDTPLTIAFGSAAGSFGTASLVTEEAATLLKTFASGGDPTAVENFGWGQLSNLAFKLAASKIPAIERWADTIGDLAEKGSDLADKSKEACE
jgi:RHS repeat-associated protein